MTTSKVISIKKIGKGKVRNLTVTKNHTFITDNGIVTHNCDPNLIMCLQGLLEGKPFYFALTGEYVKPAPGFNIIATDNTKGRGSSSGRYIGTNILNDAFLERFAVTFEQDFPSQTQEKKMVLNWMQENGKVDEQFADDLTKWAEIIRKSFKEGSVDDLISTRRLEQIIKAWTIFDDKVKAIRLCTNRFDDLTATAFVELFDKMSDAQKVKPATPDNTDANSQV